MSGNGVSSSPPKEDLQRVYHEVSGEERLGEQEAPGWILRKGEIAWMWMGNPEALDHNIKHTESVEWAAVIIRQTPEQLPSLRQQQEKKFTKPSRRNIEGKTKTYSVELCQARKPGTLLEGVEQHLLMPWVVRKDFISAPAVGLEIDEHPSVPLARKAVETYSLFGGDTAIRSVDSPEPIEVNGIFFGAEKIYVDEPIRVRGNDGEEDVLLLEKVLRVPGGESGSVRFVGNRYTTSKRSGLRAITPQEFVKMPLRMRLGMPKWSRINKPNKLPQMELSRVLGRWYEPVAVQQWCKEPDNTTLGGMALAREVANRPTALGSTSGEGNDFTVDDLRKPFQSMLATDAGNDKDDNTPKKKARGSSH
jgi:hypothetical protein